MKNSTFLLSTRTRLIISIFLLGGLVIGLFMFSYRDFSPTAIRSGYLAIALASLFLAGFYLWTNLRLRRKIFFLEGSLDAVELPITTTDLKMKWVFVNKLTEMLLAQHNLDKRTVLGKHCSNWQADICDTPNCGINSLRSGKPRTFYTQEYPDQPSTLMQVDTNYIHDDGGRRIGHVEIVTNIETTNSIRKTEEVLSRTSETLLANATEMSKAADELNSQSTTTAAAVEQASVSIQEMAEGAGQASSSTNTVASAAEEVSVNLSTVGAAVEELSTSMTTIASNTESATESVNAAATAIEEMSASLSEVARNCADGSQMSSEADGKARGAGETMAALNEAAAKVDKVVETITGIAAQTNLLALNATIEAASAGDAGKGFAVVASEVKELAKQTAQATEEISQLIGEMQDKTNDAVSSTNTISELIGQLNGTVQTIASAVEEQSATTNEISSNIARAATGVRDVSTSVQEVAQGATEISRNSQEANTGAGEMAKDISAIATSINEISKATAEAAKGMTEISQSMQSVSASSEVVKSTTGQTTLGSEELSGLASRMRELVRTDESV